MTGTVLIPVLAIKLCLRPDPPWPMFKYTSFISLDGNPIRLRKDHAFLQYGHSVVPKTTTRLLGISWATLVVEELILRRVFVL